MFAAALARNRYDGVDSIAFRTGNGDTFTYTFFDDAFPRGVSERVLRFAADQFDDAWFRRGRRLPADGVHPAPGDPARELDADQRRELRTHFAGDLSGLIGRADPLGSISGTDPLRPWSR